MAGQGRDLRAILPVRCITTGIWAVIWATPIWLLVSIVA
jgi:hypothetical protein